MIYDGTQNNLVSITSILGGFSDNTGSGIAHRLGNYCVFDFAFQHSISLPKKLNMIGIHVQWRWNGFGNTSCHV